MGELLAQLVPEMLGLAVTPAAVVACLVLLGSDHPIRNVAIIAAVFLVVYAALAAIVVSAGAHAGGSDGDGNVRAGVSLAVGLLFLAAGVATWWRRPDVRAGDPAPAPGWVRRLAHPNPRFVVVTALVLAVANPNIAILASGSTVIAVADVGSGARVVAMLVLLASSMVDFAVPVLAFAVAGESGRRWLRHATQWLISHNRPIGIVVLLAFGLLFAARGAAHLVG